MHRLERGEASLDEAIALWERGEELYRLCAGKLDTAQGRIDELQKRILDLPEPEGQTGSGSAS